MAAQSSEEARGPFVGENIPPELLDLRRWVTWRIETRNGNPTKVPYDPYTGRRAASDNPRTWGTFEDAADTCASGGYAGVGFMLGDGFVGVDLDKCRNPETGEIESWAMRIIGELRSYSEISPSGTGVHIIVRGKLPEGRRRKGAVEMYDSKRYFTMTGDIVGEHRSVRDCQAELEALHARVFGAPVASKNGNGQHSPTLDEQTATPISPAATNGDQGNGALMAAGGGLVYSAQAVPDFDRFQALCETEPKFKRSWDHARRDLQDQSASAYDMALANFAVEAGWSDQEIINLLIAHRRKYCADLKLRDTYYVTTINRARETFAGPVEQPTGALSDSPDPDADAPSREEHLAKISSNFGVRVVRVTKYGGEQDGTYELVVLDSAGIERKVDLGRAIDVLNPRLTQGAIAGATGAVIPNFKKDARWLNICRSIFAAHGVAPVEQAAEQQEMLSWLRRCLRNTHVDSIDERDKRGVARTLRERGPAWAFWNEQKQLLIHLDGLMALLPIHANARPNWRDVCLRLRKLGFRPGDLEGYDAEGRARINVWRSPHGFDCEGA